MIVVSLRMPGHRIYRSVAELLRNYPRIPRVIKFVYY